jgi:uncharacterized cupredoxin-like copper-binding protein
MSRAIPCLAAILALALDGGAFAHGEKPGAKPRTAISADVHPWGKEGDPRKAVRTIAIDMADTMRYSPAEVQVKQGETVKFVVSNSGKQMHEMVIGTEEELRRHAEMMKKLPGMEHDEPYMAHVGPGKKEQITWTFTKAGRFMFGCLVPGHWEAGMKGTIVVRPKQDS